MSIAERESQWWRERERILEEYQRDNMCTLRRLADVKVGEMYTYVHTYNNDNNNSGVTNNFLIHMRLF